MLGDDLSVFFDAQEFAITASAGGRSFLVIFAENFDPQYMNPLFNYTYERAGAQAESRSIQAIAKTSDCTGLRGETILVKGTLYNIQQVYPIEDGQLSTLVLNEAYG